MKIFAVIGAYNGASEGTAEADAFLFPGDAPAWYEIPDSCISRSGNPFFMPEDGERLVAYPSAAYRICRLGKSIAPRFASRYYDEATIGFSVVDTARLRRLREAALPWTDAVAFDRSCLLGDFMPADSFAGTGTFRIRCHDTEQEYSPSLAQPAIDGIIAAISARNTLKTGDIILSALSPKGILLSIDTRLTVSDGSSEIMDIKIK